jgi:predicted dehydrogenase
VTSASRPLDVLVVGAGMYVSGLGTSGFGTVVPSLLQAAREGRIGRIVIAATNPANREAVLAKVSEVSSLLGASADVAYLPQSESDPHAYRKAADAQSFDCAIVSVPDPLHFAITKDLLGRRIHCLVVKPLVPTVAELDELIRVAGEHDVYGAVEFHKRFDKANLRVKRMLREGAIGEVLYALVEFSQRRTIPLEHFASWSAQTNIFQYLGVHYADLVWFCTAATPRRVLATGQKNRLAASGIDTWDAVQALIEWQTSDGRAFTSTILTNWIDSPRTTAMSDQKIKWIGTAGRVESEQKDRGLLLVNDAGVQHVNPYFSEFLPDADDRLQFGGYGHRSIDQFLRDVADLAAKRSTPRQLGGARATFEDAWASTAIVEAANASLGRGGEWVEIPSRG